ncbi:hypothetical protein FNH73_15740 [Salmonella enterica subsp. salamae]|nr:hypothetical protein [Salmonella enterica]ECJ2264062.1 hypothetical protein [Salmonella enterica subsp. salamae]
MKEVKIYTIVSDQLSPPITGESFCTDMVRHSDYAELEAKCVALAAECESKKSALAAILEHCPVNDPDIDKAVASMIAYDNLYCEKTPATDDFLAEIRAQGADELAELYFALAAHEANRYIADSWRESARLAKDHAVQIRQEAAQ